MQRTFSDLKIKTIFYSFLAVVIFFVGYLFFLRPGEAPPEFVRSLDAAPEMAERNFVGIEQLQSKHLTDTTQIFRPAQIRLYNDKVYVNDFTDFTIYEFDKDGNKLRAIKTGRGRGPGEFQNLTDFDLIDNTLWAVDSQNFMIHSFSLNPIEHLNSFSVDRRPMRITCLEDGFIVQWLGTELLFSRFDYEGNELNQFGQIIEEDQVRHTLSLGGTIRSNRKNRFVYIPSYASLIYHYHENGELVNILKAPDGLEFPVTKKEGNTSFAPDFSFYEDAYMDEKNNLYVYTRFPGERNTRGEWEGEQWSAVDKYDLVSGRYSSSLQLPFMGSSAMFNPKTHTLYTSDFAKSFIHSSI